MNDQAMKLFEALSDVDHELLERCNRQRNKKIAYMPIWKYKRAMTACLCMVVVGALSWGGYRLVGGRKGSSGNAFDSAASSSAPAQMQEMAEPQESWEGAAGATGGSASQYVSPAEAKAEDVTDTERQMEFENSDQGGTNQSGNITDSNASEAVFGSSTTDNIDSPIADRSNAEKVQAQKEAESAVLDSRTEISWEDACAAEPFGSYLPNNIPAGYEPLGARQSAVPDKRNNMIFKWGNGENVLYLNMTVKEGKDKDEIKAEIERSDGLYQYPAEDFEKGLIPEPIDGQIKFTLYYTDGMVIDFAGHVTVEEMWELVKSIPK